MAKKTFEQAMSRLDEIVGKLEDGSLSLDQSLKLFEEGMELSRFCETKLEDANGRVQRLVKDGEEFKLESERE